MAQKYYSVKIREVLAELVDIKANSPEEAEDKARQMYRDEKIVLDSSNYVDTEFILMPEETAAGEFPAAELAEVVAYLWEDERRNWEELDMPKTGHIFNSINRLNTWLSQNGGK